MKNNPMNMETQGRQAMVRAAEVQLNAAARELLKEMRPLVDRGGEEIVFARRELGRLVDRAAEAPGKYGRRSIVTIAECLGCGRDLLDDARRVALVWPIKRNLESLLNKRDAVYGRPPTLQLLVEIAKHSLRAVSEGGVIDRAALEPERQRWIDRWLESGLSARDMRALAQTDGPAEAAGLDFTPRDVHGFVRSLKSSSDAATNQLSIIEARLVDLVDNDAAAQTPTCVRLLTEAKESMEKQQDVLVDQLQSIKRRIAMVRGVLKKSSSAPAAKEAA